MRFVFLLLIFVITLSCKIEANQSVDLNYAVVQDYANLFSKTEEDSLSKSIIDYEKISTNQICVYTIDSIPTLDNPVIYASKIANQLGVGQAGKDNGLFILISKQDRQIAFATGYGTEKILTDSICKRLIDSTLIPSFKKEFFFKGLAQVLDSVKIKWVD